MTEGTKDIRFSILLKDKDMFRFLLRHTYVSFSGVFGVIISLLALCALVLYHDGFETYEWIALTVVALLFTVIQPLQLRSKAKRQIKGQKMFAEPLSYIINDEGIVIHQQDQEVVVNWSEVRKVVETKKEMFVYLSSVRAFIFPKDQCAQDYDKFREMVIQYSHRLKG